MKNGELGFPGMPAMLLYHRGRAEEHCSRRHHTGRIILVLECRTDEVDPENEELIILESDTIQLMQPAQTYVVRQEGDAT